MTNKEALRILSNMIHDDKVIYGDKPKPSIEALVLAIKALEERPQGIWEQNADEGQRIDPPYLCSNCGHANLRKTPFCEMCGMQATNYVADTKGDK